MFLHWAINKLANLYALRLFLFNWASLCLLAMQFTLSLIHKKLMILICASKPNPLLPCFWVLHVLQLTNFIASISLIYICDTTI